MIKRYPYKFYVVAVFIVWALVFVVTWRTLSAHKFHNVLIFGCGFLIGVIGASIARKVYK